MILRTCIFYVSLFVGSSALASNCSDMAAFKSQIDKFLNTASITDTLKADVKKLADECGLMHNQGMAVSTIDSCGDALKMIMIN